MVAHFYSIPGIFLYYKPINSPRWFFTEKVLKQGEGPKISYSIAISKKTKYDV